MSDIANAKGFYGVYLLCSESTGKCYIGFTVNPNRRIKQHNRGQKFGGAKKTSNKGPWKMVLLVHGFPNNISALQFEWAWQQPTLSSRLKLYNELKRKQPKESYFQYNFRILNRMLLVGPWTRLPLIIRWLEPSYSCDFHDVTNPPKHMQIVYGNIVVKNKKHKDQAAPYWASECHLCMKHIENPKISRIGCLNKLCKLTCHLICLANHMISSDRKNQGHYIPIYGECPLCETNLTWAELLIRKRQINGTTQDEENDDINEAFEETDSDDSDEVFLEKESTDCVENNALCEIYELSD